MAKIDWTENFQQQLDLYLGNYSPESLLHDRKILYRRCQVMNRRFKLIYYYDEAEDTVHLVDINPIMYTKKEWEASRITPFYHNVLKDAIVL